MRNDVFVYTHRPPLPSPSPPPNTYSLFTMFDEGTRAAQFIGIELKPSIKRSHRFNESVLFEKFAQFRFSQGLVFDLKSIIQKSYP